MHWKAMMDRDFIFAFDLGGKDVTVTIDRVVGGTVSGTGGKKNKKPVMYFSGKEKGLALNSTNCKCIAKLFGSNDTDDWVGKQIILYPTMTTFGSEEVECIRVRPHLPEQKRSKAAPEPPASAEDDGR